MFVLTKFKACFNGHYDLVKFLIENNANLNLRDKNGQNALHYAVMGKHEKISKLLCNYKIDSTQMSLQGALDPRDLALATVPDLNYDRLKLAKNPMQHKYAKEMKTIIDAEESILKRDEARYVEDKLFELINRYRDQNLSEMDSDDDDIQKGNAVKKEKKKKKGGKKKSKASGKKKKKGKAAKK